jgi:hypothetical protein
MLNDQRIGVRSRMPNENHSSVVRDVFDGHPGDGTRKPGWLPPLVQQSLIQQPFLKKSFLPPRSSTSSTPRPSSTGHSSHGYSAHSSPRSKGTTASSSGAVHRDSHGRIKRSAEAKDAFKRQQPCPSTGRSSGACPGYVIDHVKPLATGGADAPSNMQWQT